MPTVPNNANINAEPNLTIKEKKIVRDIFSSISGELGIGTYSGSTPPAPTAMVTQAYPGNGNIVPGFYGNSSGYTLCNILRITNVVHSATVQQTYRIRTAWLTGGTARDVKLTREHTNRSAGFVRMVYTGANPDTRIDCQHVSIAHSASGNYPPNANQFTICFGPDTEVSSVVGGTYDHYIFLFRG